MKVIDIGSQIVQIRKGKGLQAQQLADMVGISPKHMSEIENSKKYPRWELLCTIFFVLDVEVTLTTVMDVKQQKKVNIKL